jgi:hypothetical protein
MSTMTHVGTSPIAILPSSARGGAAVMRAPLIELEFSWGEIRHVHGFSRPA